MGKLSFIKWYPADWINDTRELSPESKAAWIDILCLMWNAPSRGVWKGTHEEFARATGLPWEIAPRIISELGHKVAGVTLRDKEVTLENRRMMREDLIYKNHANRQKEYRKRCMSDAKVIPKKLDVRSQKLETPNTLHHSQGEPARESGPLKPVWQEEIGRPAPNHFISPPKPSHIEAEIVGSLKRRKAFAPPTPEEVEAYAKSIDFDLDGENFCAHYDASGWMRGKTKIVNWKACVWTWKKRMPEKQGAFRGG